MNEEYVVSLIFYLSRAYLAPLCYSFSHYLEVSTGDKVQLLILFCYFYFQSVNRKLVVNV